jgi:hypothetical protein
MEATGVMMTKAKLIKIVVIVEVLLFIALIWISI